MTKTQYVDYANMATSFQDEWALSEERSRVVLTTMWSDSSVMGVTGRTSVTLTSALLALSHVMNQSRNSHEHARYLLEKATVGLQYGLKHGAAETSERSELAMQGCKTCQTKDGLSVCRVCKQLFCSDHGLLGHIPRESVCHGCTSHYRIPSPSYLPVFVPKTDSIVRFLDHEEISYVFGCWEVPQDSGNLSQLKDELRTAWVRNSEWGVLTRRCLPLSDALAAVSFVMNKVDSDKFAVDLFEHALVAIERGFRIGRAETENRAKQTRAGCVICHSLDSELVVCRLCKKLSCTDHHTPDSSGNNCACFTCVDPSLEKSKQG